MDISNPSQFRQMLHISNDLQWDIENPRSAFHIEMKIGKGAFGKVFRATHLASNMIMAIKCVEMNEEESIDLRKEIEVLRKLKHENIVQLFGCIPLDSKTWILMELCEMGSASDVMRRFPTASFSEEIILAILFFVLQGLIYLHGKGIVHRDIKVGSYPKIYTPLSLSLSFI